MKHQKTPIPTILVVEDSPTQRALLRYLIERQGYQVLECENGKVALSMLKSEHIDLILSDVIMPIMDGLTFCKLVKQNKALQSIPLILMTALDGISEIGKGLEAGADNFIYKPYDPDALVARMSDLLPRVRSKKSANAITLGGKTYTIHTNPERILQLLVSSFEDAITINQQLKEREAQLQSAKEEAELANTYKSRFLATMSHEIRTPMTGVLGLLELLSLSKLDADQKRTLMTVLDSGKALIRVIDDILDYTKIEAGKLEVLPSPASVKTLLKKLYNLYSGAASSKGLTFNSYCDPHISKALLFDTLRLQQIIGNFLSNAIQYTPEGAIDMRAELVKNMEDEEQLQFIVRDTGIGISPEIKKRLFKPFSNIYTEVETLKGTGLGLVISNRLAELMGGTIDVDTTLGQGTTMTLTLTFPIAASEGLLDSPLEEAPKFLSQKLLKRRPPPSVKAAQKENSLILVVDDHPVNRKVLIRQLNILGYAVLGAESGKEALNMLASKHYGLVITDCNMPEMTGYELTSIIREQEALHQKDHIPIIGCTANAQPEARVQCLKSGMDDLMIKPIELLDLMGHIDHWLPVSEGEPVDWRMLKEIVGEDESAMNDILMDFKENNEKDVKGLIKAIKNHDLKTSMNLAHRIKGASQLIGASALSNVCLLIEEASRNGDEKAVNDYLKRFEYEANTLKHYLESL